MSQGLGILGVPLMGGEYIAPTCVLSAAVGPFNAPFAVTATWSESVVGFAVGDISVTNGAASGLSGSNPYLFTVTPAADGPVTVQIGAAVCKDLAGNNNTASNLLTRSYDATRPNCVVACVTAEPIDAAITVTFTFDEVVTGFTSGDITVEHAALSDFTGDTFEWSATITPDWSGAVSVSVAAGVCQDAAGNTNNASNTLTRTIYPYTADFSALPDGPLPARLLGSAWSIVSGVASPTLTGAGELLTGGNLEAAYTSGLCDSLTKNGAPTVAESADAHGGTKAQSFTATGGNDRLNFAPINPGVDKQWYIFTAWAKAATANGGVRFEIQQVGGPTESVSIVGAAYAQKTLLFRAKTAGAIFVFPAWENTAGPFDTVLVDDISGVALADYNELFATLLPTQADVVIKARPATLTGGRAGIIARSDQPAGSSPASYLQAYITQSGPYIYARLDKLVAGVLTQLLEEYITETALADLELRLSGTGVQMWYNNAQLGATQTVSDAKIVGNTIHGLFAGGGGRLARFFVQAN